MAMDSKALASDIQEAMEKTFKDHPKFKLKDENGDTLLPFICETIAKAVALKVVDHIKKNFEATVIVAEGIPVMTTGTAASQSGKTTAKGTGEIEPGSIK